jgi:hypothetical protein
MGKIIFMKYFDNLSKLSFIKAKTIGTLRCGCCGSVLSIEEFAKKEWA